MGVQTRFGTAGATGGGFSAQTGTLQPSFDDRLVILPVYDWQKRGLRSWKDRNNWDSLWSYGCRIGYGKPSGSDGVSSNRDLSTPDLFEPYSCDGEGTQSKNAIRGITKDSGGTPIANAIVQGFVTSTDAYVGEVTSNNDGTYTLMTEQLKTTAHYLVAYKAGSPDTAGTTVNTLLPTNVDGT
jgi:hypothetical protein